MQSEIYGADESWKEIFSFVVETMETAVKSWHETSKVDGRVYFVLDKEKTQTDKYAPVVNIDKVGSSLPPRLNVLILPISCLNAPPVDFECSILVLCVFLSPFFSC